MEGVQAIVAWIQQFPIASVPTLFWVIFWLTLIVMLMAWRREAAKISRSQVAALGFAFVLMIGTDQWRQTAGYWEPLVTIVFYVASIAALVVGVASLIGVILKTR